MNITKTFELQTQADWRRWLSKNHATQKEIWVVFYKKSTGKQTVTLQQVLDEALCFGWIDGMEKGMDNERYALRFTPRSAKSNWSKINIKRYQELLKAKLVEEAGKQAFANKGRVYQSFSMPKGATDWHLVHHMPKNATTEQRIAWHTEHRKFCGCRPVPKSLAKYF